MKHTSVLAVFALLPFSHAAPSLLPQVAAGTIGSQCINVRVQDDWLVGDCLTGSGSDRITSGTYLTYKIMNDDGNLVWKDGSYANSCYDCKLLDGGSKINCQCRPHTGPRHDTTLNLDEHIGVYSGHLLSNLKEEPVVPSTPSKYPFPTDFHWGYGGNATCTGPDAYWCDSQNFKNCVPADRTSWSSVAFTTYSPYPDCFIPTVFGIHFEHSIMRIAGQGAWELTGYADEECKTKQIVIGEEDVGKCINVGSQRVKAIKARPLFNGDPN